MPPVIAGFPLFCPWPPLKGCWRIDDYYCNICNIITECHHYDDTLFHKSMLPRLPGLPPISPIRGFFTLIRPQWIISPSQIPAVLSSSDDPAPATQAHMSLSHSFGFLKINIFERSFWLKTLICVENEDREYSEAACPGRDGQLSAPHKNKINSIRGLE